MKTLHLGRNGQTMVKLMNEKEFLRFMKNKTVYHHDCNWISEWRGILPITDYFPFEGFVLPSYVKLARYHSTYPESCLSAHSVQGKFYKSYPCWKVTIKENKAKTKKTFYVTELNPL